MFTQSKSLELYGRVWEFEIASNKSFNALAGSRQPLTILISGIVIDLMLLALFMFLTRANRKALRYADSATHRLQIEKLRLERSNADLEQFAYIASHDLQEPLRMVGSFTQLLQKRYEGKLDDKADSYIHYAVDGVTRMQRLLNDLLRYSRVGSDGAPLMAANSYQACQAAVENLGEVIQETNATIEIGELPEVLGDETQLVQLFQNLIANSIKFTLQDRSPDVRVSGEECEGDCIFSVADNGIGIASDYHEKVFVMFQRLHKRVDYPGTGVGLAICKKIVVRHGGRIWVDSTPGAGTTVRFTLAKVGPNIVSLSDGTAASAIPPEFERRAS